MSKTVVGFGFGPIQSGLFLHEAEKSGNFARLVVAEIAGDIVHNLRQSGGKYTINIAKRDRIPICRWTRTCFGQRATKL